MKPTKRSPRISLTDLTPEYRAKLFLRINRTVRATPSGCLEWLGAKDGNGYPVISVAGKPERVQRIVWLLRHGDIPETSDLVCHRCDNKACLRDEHLFLADHAANMRDMVAKGRSLRGERCPSAKITSEDVLQILELHREGLTQRTIAEQFNLQRSTVGDILTGKSWSHLTGLRNRHPPGKKQNRLDKGIPGNQGRAIVSGPAVLRALTEPGD